MIDTRRRRGGRNPPAHRCGQLPTTYRPPAGPPPAGGFVAAVVSAPAWPRPPASASAPRRVGLGVRGASVTVAASSSAGVSPSSLCASCPGRADDDLAGLEIDALAAGGVADLLAGGLQPALLLIHVPLGRIEERVEAPLRHSRRLRRCRTTVAGSPLMARAPAARSLDACCSRGTRPSSSTAERALRGRDSYEFAIPHTHYVTGRPIQPPFPDGLQTAVFGLGCFWGAEEVFWQTAGRVDDRGRATPAATRRTRPTRRCAPG